VFFQPTAYLGKPGMEPLAIAVGCVWGHGVLIVLFG